MKKFALSLAVLATFVVYSLGIRHQNDETKVVKPSSLSAGSSSPSVTTTTSSTTSASSTQYKDGTYTGSVANAFYGNIQVSATISGGKITNVTFLQYPNDRQNSVAINQQAMPYLKQEAIQAQSANVQIVSGATLTSQAFQQSLSNALQQAS